jgi:hypothetical protein
MACRDILARRRGTALSSFDQRRRMFVAESSNELKGLPEFICLWPDQTGRKLSPRIKHLRTGKLTDFGQAAEDSVCRDRTDPRLASVDCKSRLGKLRMKKAPLSV